ncbi:NAD(P)-binding protein [Aspergillus alliaceus]|uniref:NAD(P)-binding protein n=1 Tax=Petromyces alliaceus TaxID=209559 RepID=UPI0012A3BAB5|nr:NAD(P)-binding protein [Aspergillus alliaceus]KAB8227148.1 NAD(P)-binding protein [Aspergillus alliaceus]
MPSYLITGASRGLGYTWLKHLSSNPENIVIGLVRNKSATQKRLVTDNLTNIYLVCADITDAKSLRTVAEQVGNITGGSLDILINNAAILTVSSAFNSIVDLSPEVLEENILDSCRTNVVGVAHTINAFLPLIRKGCQKKVIVVSSLLADIDFVSRFALDTATPYSISKAAANLLMAKYHAALGPTEGILFLAISPGVVSKPDTTPTVEEAEGRQKLVSKLKTYAPHFTGPITMEESVRMQVEVIDKATVETSGGTFVSHFGNKQWL